LLCILTDSQLSEAETPDQFLRVLASASVEEWLQTASVENNPFTPDSVEQRIGSLQHLSVEPGQATLEDCEGGYRAIFSESRWTWRLPGGEIGSVTGTSIIEWHPGGYRWVTLPVLTEEGAVLGFRESVCMGVTAMGVVMLVAVLALWYAKRRFG